MAQPHNRRPPAGNRETPHLSWLRQLLRQQIRTHARRTYRPCYNNKGNDSEIVLGEKQKAIYRESLRNNNAHCSRNDFHGCVLHRQITKRRCKMNKAAAGVVETDNNCHFPNTPKPASDIEETMSDAGKIMSDIIQTTSDLFSPLSSP